MIGYRGLSWSSSTTTTAARHCSVPKKNRKLDSHQLAGGQPPPSSQGDWCIVEVCDGGERLPLWFNLLLVVVVLRWITVSESFFSGLQTWWSRWPNALPPCSGMSRPWGHLRSSSTIPGSSFSCAATHFPLLPPLATAAVFAHWEICSKYCGWGFSFTYFCMYQQVKWAFRSSSTTKSMAAYRQTIAGWFFFFTGWNKRQRDFPRSFQTN